MCNTLELSYIERISAISNGFSFPFDLICLDKGLDIPNPRHIEPISVRVSFPLSVRNSCVRLYFTTAFLKKIVRKTIKKEEVNTVKLRSGKYASSFIKIR